MKKKLYLGLALLATTALLTGCSTPQYSAGATVTEKIQLSAKMQDYSVYYVCHADYYIPANLFTAKERDAYINNSDLFLETIAHFYEGDEISSIRIYIAPDLVTYGDKDVAYINSADLNTVKGYTALLTAVTGEACDYGQAYGCATAILEDQNIPYDAPSADTLAESLKDHTDLLSFYLPAFENTFVDEDTIALSSAAAAEFGKYYANTYGLEAAFASILTPDETLATAKNDWLSSIGCESTYEAAVYPLTFTHSWKDYELYPYCIATDTMNVYLRVADVEKTGYTKSMQQTEAILKDAEYDFLAEQAVLYDYIGEVDPIDIYTMFSINNSEMEAVGAMYRGDFNDIIIYYGWGDAKFTLDHEYAHYLTLHYNLLNLASTPNWIMEGYAEEIAAYEAPNTLQIHYYQELIDTESSMYQTYAEEGGYWNSERNEFDPIAYNEAYTKALVTGQEDGSTCFTVSHESKVRGEITNLSDTTYYECAAMIAYMIDNYGKENYLTVAKDITQFESIYGCSPYEFYLTWRTRYFDPM